jgi:hypothetical protein
MSYFMGEKRLKLVAFCKHLPKSSQNRKKKKNLSQHPFRTFEIKNKIIEKIHYD